MNNVELDQSFRDSLSIVSKKGNRLWVYAKRQKGKLYNLRHTFGFILLSFLLVAPFIKINGHQLLLFNIPERTFVIFGFPFFPQDFFLVGLAMLSFIVAVVLFTSMFGRVFCGWACPQTIFMEMIFRKIEYWIEGDNLEQKKLDDSPNSFSKISRKIFKWVVFYIISFIIANVFLAYIIGSDELIKIITNPPSKHIAGFFSILLFSGIFFFVFAYLRELVCIIVCPYGRLQGVLMDNESVVVSYDNKRGEPRGKIKRNESKADNENGDCIDCGMCVRVCPTAIDIRNGTQLECINCAACIDACNEIMVKVDKEPNLIKYASYNQIQSRSKFKPNGRHFSYMAILIILISFFAYLIHIRPDVALTLLKTPGQLYSENGDGTITNIYNADFLNKTFEVKDLSMRAVNLSGASIKFMNGQKSVKVGSGKLLKEVVAITLPNSVIQSNKTKVIIELLDNEKVINRVETNFVAPVR